jgi:hypothetical protein
MQPRVRRTYLPFMAMAALSLAAAPGCQKDDKSMEAALKRIDDRLAKIESTLEKGVPARAGAAGARGQQRRGRPPGPDPQAVYSVPIAGSPYSGAEHAKVTVVEAFEFA